MKIIKKIIEFFKSAFHSEEEFVEPSPHGKIDMLLAKMYDSCFYPGETLERKKMVECLDAFSMHNNNNKKNINLNKEKG